ncbi:hypothetical protein BH23GEM10_BH23GEM10_04490 [soil metagenome]
MKHARTMALLALVLVVSPTAPLHAQARASADGGGTVQRIALADGDTVAITTTGAGPAVVIVPGLLGSHVSFRHVTDRLVAAGQRVLVIDPLGTGRSSRPKDGDYSLEAQAARLAATLDAVGASDVILVCHSVGGSMCYRLALRDPTGIRAIVAINAGPDERAATPGLRFAMRFAPLARLFGGAGHARSRATDGLKKSSFDAAWVTDDVVARYTRPFTDMDATFNALEGMAGARDTVPLVPRLADVLVPVRLLVGAAGRDGVTKDDEIEVLRGIPDFDVSRVADAGAYVQEERPQAVVDVVLGLRVQRGAERDIESLSAPGRRLCSAQQRSRSCHPRG